MEDILAFDGGATTSNVGSGARLTTRYTQAQTDAAAGSVVITPLLDGLYASAVQSGQGGLQGVISTLSTLAANELIYMVNADVTLPSQTVQAALTILIGQMIAASASVNASTPGAGAQTAAVGDTPVGNPTILATVINGKGTSQEYMLAEVINFVCTNDVPGGATANQQPFIALGQAQATGGQLSYLWPAGSGSSTTINCVDSLQNNSANNLLTNSDFDTFSNGSSTNTSPDNWIRVLGSSTWGAGSSGNAYASSSNCLAMTSDGSTLSSITQTFNTTASTSLDSGGTPGTLSEDTVYGVNLYIKASATPSTGVMKIDLIDGSGTILNNDAGTAQTIAKTLTAVSTSYINVSGVFQTPLNLPSTVKIRIRFSTAVENGKIIYLDHLAMTPMVSLYGGVAPYYNGGPLFAVFSGNTQPRISDAWTITTTQTFGIFQEFFQRVFSITQYGLQLPSSGSPTVSDSLVA